MASGIGDQRRYRRYYDIICIGLILDLVCFYFKKKCPRDPVRSGKIAVSLSGVVEFRSCCTLIYIFLKNVFCYYVCLVTFSSVFFFVLFFRNCNFIY